MSETRRQITALIRRYVAALEAQEIPVERGILFGGHAAGYPDQCSDIDSAVISPAFAPMPLLQRYEHLGLANRELQAPLDIVGFAPSQVAHCERGSFLAEILDTGVDVPLRAPEARRTRRLGAQTRANFEAGCRPRRSCQPPDVRRSPTGGACDRCSGGHGGRRARPDLRTAPPDPTA